METMDIRPSRNPNLVDVYASNDKGKEEDEEDDDMFLGFSYLEHNDDDDDDVRRGSKRSTDTFISDELDDIIHASMHSDNNNNQRKRRTQSPSIGPGLPRLPGGKSVSNTNHEGLFLHDWEAGTPYDKFDFNALIQHLERRAKLMTDPVIKLVAAIAVSSGTTLNNLLLNSSLPLVNTNATTMKGLLDGSRLDSGVIVALLSVILREQLAVPGKLASVPVKKEEQPSVNIPGKLSPIISPKRPSRPNDGDESRDGSPINPDKFAGEYIGDALHMLKKHSNGHSLPAQYYSTPQFEFIGVENPPQQFKNTLLQEMINVFSQYSSMSDVSRWVWNALPENSGIKLVREETQMVIRQAYEEIRSLSPSHAKFKLWHLMTSPGVLSHFAQMIGSAINNVPGDMINPGWQSMRGGDAIMGARVSNGITSRIAAGRAWNVEKRWFKNVRYTENTIYTDAVTRMENHASIVNGEKQGVKLSISALTGILHDGGGLLDKIQQANFLRMTKDLYDRIQESARLREVVLNLTARYRVMRAATTGVTAVDISNASDVILDEKNNLAIVMTQIEAIRSTIRSSLPLSPVGAEPRIEHALLYNGVMLVPFIGASEKNPASPFEGGANYEGTRSFSRKEVTSVFGQLLRDPNKIILACEDGIRSVEEILERIYAWRGNSLTPLFGKLLAAFSNVKTSISNLHTANKNWTRDRFAISIMNEDDKIVLKYSKPMYRKARNWAFDSEQSVYAEI